MISIRSYDQTLTRQWDDYVTDHRDGTIFHMIGWMRAILRSFGHTPHYVIAFQGETVCGLLPLFEVRSTIFGHSLVSVPFAVYGGILASDEESFDVLRRHAEELADTLNVEYLELRAVAGSGSDESSSGEVVSRQPQREKWHTKGLYVTFRREIYPSLEQNLQAIPRKQRAMVRKGEKSGLTSAVSGTDDLAAFYRIYATNVRDLGTPVYPIGFFGALMQEFPETFILSVRMEGEMVAGVLTFVYKDELLPYYGGGLRDSFNLAVNDFMYWELMKFGCVNGYKVFDFGRSKKETGSYRFKKHWGFEPADLRYRFYLVNKKEMPNVSPLNPKYRLMIETWKKLPLPVANWLGPKLVRGIP